MDVFFILFSINKFEFILVGRIFFILSKSLSLTKSDHFILLTIFLRESFASSTNLSLHIVITLFSSKIHVAVPVYSNSVLYFSLLSFNSFFAFFRLVISLYIP